MADGLEMTPEELARLLEEVRNYRPGRPPPPPPPGWTLAAWLRFLGALGLMLWSFWFLYRRIDQARHLEDTVELPPGGAPCTSSSPQELALAQVKWHASGWSFSGDAEAFKDALADAEEKARKQGAGICMGACGPGKRCQGVPAVQEVSYTSWTQLWLATRCNLTYTVHCECV